MTVYHKDVLAKEMAPGIERRVLSHSDNLMLAEFHFRPGAVVETHAHVHEQITYVISGRFEAEMAGETVVLGPGDSIYCPSNEPHRVTALEETVSIDVFTPQREDFLK